MFRRLGPLVALALLAAGVSSAAGQQPAPSCLGAALTIAGTPADDTLVGTSGRDVINGLQGNDTIDGGASAGFSAAVYVEAPGGVSVDLTAGTATGASGNDTLVNVNTVLGSRRADRLKGSPGQDLLLGLGGADTLVGSGGPDILAGGGGNDSLDGGAGFDYADYEGARSGIRVNLTRGIAFGEGQDRLRRMEGAIGGPSGDKLIGNGRDNELFGDRGNDTLEGRGGRDLLNSGRGRDHLDGGPGRDRCRAGEVLVRCP